MFPPINLVLPCIRFIIENSRQASIVLPLDEITPLWLPDTLPYITDAFVLGHKRETGMIKVPSKRGFIPDLVGLTSNLWVLRIGNKKPNNVFLGKMYNEESTITR